VSISGGVDRAVERGAALGCTVLQIFTRNQRRWKTGPLREEEVARFLSRREECPGVRSVLAHGSYLCNPASPDPGILDRSLDALSEELDRCTRLGIPLLVIHPGAHRGAGEEAGIERAILSLREVLGRARGEVSLCLETTSGQGTGIGYRFAHLNQIIRGVESVVEKTALGVCLDTAHVFAAGYDIRSAAQVDDLLDEFEKRIGLDRLKVFHLNDSLVGLGSRRDRHTHVGLGLIGEATFRRVMTHPDLAGVPKILETPKKREGEEMDPVNLSLLRRFAAEGQS
jgi:deoxyribonuclease-4